MFRPTLPFFSLSLMAATISGAGLPPREIPNAGLPPREIPNQVIVSVPDQKLMLLHNGERLAIYPVSTSKYGLGDSWGRMTTPLGCLQVAQKIGDHAPTGAVFHNRRFTGEILAPNAPGRDPVITRIIWLRGLEQQNAHAFARCIYIHGTPQEKFVGKPASFGCIRMKSGDVTELYSQLPVGALVQIVNDRLPNVKKVSKAEAKILAETPAADSEDWVKSAAARKTPSGTRKTTIASAKSVPRA
jgi:lipoprotein-anchoring transpeptidase ErfK/SrfK